MINNLVSRVIAIVNISILINIVLIDSLMSNLIQIGLIDSKFKHFELRLKFQLFISSSLIICLIYVLYSLCFNKFFIFVTIKTQSGDLIKPSKLDLVVFVLIPFLVWCFLFLSLVNLHLNRDLYTSHMYHKQPVNYKRKTDLASINNKLKSIIKSKLTFFNSKKESNEDDYLNDENKLNDLPWYILDFNESQSIELELKYFKYCLFTFINIIFCLLLFIRLNVYAKFFIR